MSKLLHNILFHRKDAKNAKNFDTNMERLSDCLCRIE